MSSPDTEPPDMGPSPALAEGEGDISSSRDASSNDLCTFFCFVVDVCRASTEHLFGTHRIFFLFSNRKEKNSGDLHRFLGAGGGGGGGRTG